MMIRIQYPKWLTFVIVASTIVCFARCTVFSPPPDETSSPGDPLSSATNPASPSLSPTLTCPAPSSTPNPTSTFTPTPLPTSAPIPAASSTPRPTLTAREEYNYVREMLATNDGCELPCWWGVTPEKSSWQEGKDGLPSSLDFQFWFPEETVKYDLHLTLSRERNLVKTIDVRSECFECKRFGEDWQRYSLDQVLNRYGPPSRVRIVLAPPIDAGGPTYYILYIFYDDLGIGIIYMGAATQQDEMLRTCFSFQNITLLLQSPKSSSSLEHTIDPYEWTYAVPLDEATGIHIEEFYETFRHSGACLEAPATVP